MSTLFLVETVVLLLVVVLALITLAQRIQVPYPILLVLGGLVLSFLPAVPTVPLDPELVFLIFLPPILWAAAYFTSLRDFVANFRPIALLAVGLVLATSAAVAVVARLVMPGLSWPVAFALGAIVSPPDAVAATAIARRLGLPHRLVTILEGESLINDAVALVLYRSAIAATLTGGFSIGQVAGQFVLTAVGGLVIGLGVGALARWALRRTSDSLAAIAVTLLAPYAAWIVAERLHISAVLACVAGGLYLRQSFSEVASPAMRLQGRAVWDLLIFVLNGLIFILIGLQLASIRQAGLSTPWTTLLAHGAVISATAIVVRLLWVPLVAGLSPLLGGAGVRPGALRPQWRVVVVVGWAGMRGIVSLAAALALPLAAGRAPFPYREEIIVLAFAVILSTLVLQGLTLSPLIRLLRLDHDPTLEAEEAHARETAIRAALERLEQVQRAPWARRDQVERMRALYAQRLARSSAIVQSADPASRQTEAGYRRLRHAILDAERQAVVALRDDGVISDEVLHRLEQELDVEAMRTGLGETRMGGPA
jgi:CPA1 family monovalent cation:H+ antiporter